MGMVWADDRYVGMVFRYQIYVRKNEKGFSVAEKIS